MPCSRSVWGLIALTIWLVSLTMLARTRVTSWLQRSRPWSAVIAANSMIMTVFLWHLSAMLVAVGIAGDLFDSIGPGAQRSRQLVRRQRFVGARHGQQHGITHAGPQRFQDATLPGLPHQRFDEH